MPNDPTNIVWFVDAKFNIAFIPDIIIASNVCINVAESPIL